MTASLSQTQRTHCTDRERLNFNNTGSGIEVVNSLNRGVYFGKFSRENDKPNVVYSTGD